MKPFTVTTVGSWPRPRELAKARLRFGRGEITRAELERVEDEAVLASLRAQEEAGVELVTDGEQRRDNFYSFVAEKLEGVRLMTLAEMLDVVEDKAGFRRILDTLDVPATSIKNPSCVGRISRRAPLAIDELRFLRKHTTRPIKVTLPGPYILTRAMWVKELTRGVYSSKEELAEDVVTVLRGEIGGLIEEGASFIQLDEPVLTELVFTQGQTRTFMCAALAARKDPAEELELAVSLINRVVAGVSPVVKTGVHVCRGNWSTNESTLLSGSYHPLNPYLARLDVDQLVLEHATPRAGDLTLVPGKGIGLGVVNPRTPEIETPEQIVARVEEVLALGVPPSRIALNPDCGFATFSSRPMNSEAIASAKLRSMSEAARILRSR